MLDPSAVRPNPRLSSRQAASCLVRFRRPSPTIQMKVKQIASAVLYITHERIPHLASPDESQLDVLLVGAVGAVGPTALVRHRPYHVETGRDLALHAVLRAAALCKNEECKSKERQWKGSQGHTHLVSGSSKAEYGTEFATRAAAEQTSGEFRTRNQTSNAPDCPAEATQVASVAAWPEMKGPPAQASRPPAPAAQYGRGSF